ncbi:MAG: ribonuclease HII [Clostridium sp.]|nr:ribonuclease HII [Clostridium sp.]
MIKLNILNMKNFLQTVNGCSGSVTMLYPDGKRKNINKQYGIQSQILRDYKNNKNCLGLTLDIPNPRDYLDIIFYYIGDC